MYPCVPVWVCMCLSLFVCWGVSVCGSSYVCADLRLRAPVSIICAPVRLCLKNGYVCVSMCLLIFAYLCCSVLKKRSMLKISPSTNRIKPRTSRYLRERFLRSLSLHYWLRKQLRTYLFILLGISSEKVTLFHSLMVAVEKKRSEPY